MLHGNHSFLGLIHKTCSSICLLFYEPNFFSPVFLQINHQLTFFNLNTTQSDRSMTGTASAESLYKPIIPHSNRVSAKSVFLSSSGGVLEKKASQVLLVCSDLTFVNLAELSRHIWVRPRVKLLGISARTLFKMPFREMAFHTTVILFM